jgi:hypothetical protein
VIFEYGDSPQLIGSKRLRTRLEGGSCSRIDLAGLSS